MRDVLARQAPLVEDLGVARGITRQYLEQLQWLDLDDAIVVPRYSAAEASVNG